MHRSTSVRSKKPQTASKRAKHLRSDKPIPYKPALNRSLHEIEALQRENAALKAAATSSKIDEYTLTTMSTAIATAVPSLASVNPSGGPKFRFRAEVTKRLASLPPHSAPDQILWLGTGLTATQAHVLAKVTPCHGAEDADGYEFLRALRTEGRRLYEDFDLAVYLMDEEEGDDEGEPAKHDVVYAIVRQVGGKVTAHMLGRMDDDGNLVDQYQTDLHVELRRPWERKAVAT